MRSSNSNTVSTTTDAHLQLAVEPKLLLVQEHALQLKRQQDCRWFK
jgi:hypothetical protein